MKTTRIVIWCRILVVVLLALMYAGQAMAVDYKNRYVPKKLYEQSRVAVHTNDTLLMAFKSTSSYWMHHFTKRERMLNADDSINMGAYRVVFTSGPRRAPGGGPGTPGGEIRLTLLTSNR